MCNYMITESRQCKLSKNSKFCHIHKPKLNPLQIIDLYAKQDEHIKVINTLNSIIEKNKKNYDILYKEHEKNIKESNLLLKTFNITKEICLKQDDKIIKLKTEIKNLNKTIEKKVNIIKDKDNEIKNLEKFKETNKVKLELLNKIKEYELVKQELLNKNINIYYHNDPVFHEKRKIRNEIVHEKLIYI